jgi:hypothetical protein
MTPLVAPHALLIINWSDSSHLPTSAFSDLTPENEGGAALLSLPTREYLQSSSFTPPPATTRLSPNIFADGTIDASSQNPRNRDKLLRNSKIESITSGSAFYADGHRSSVAESSSYGFPEGFQSIDISHSTSRHEMQPHVLSTDDWDMYTVSHTPSIIDTRENDDGREAYLDDEPQSMEERQVEHSAFVGSMIYALTRKLLPGGLWSPRTGVTGGSTRNQGPIYPVQEERKWGLDECLRSVDTFTSAFLD